MLIPTLVSVQHQQTYGMEINVFAQLEHLVPTVLLVQPQDHGLMTNVFVQQEKHGMELIVYVQLVLLVLTV